MCECVCVYTFMSLSIIFFFLVFLSFLLFFLCFSFVFSNSFQHWTKQIITQRRLDCKYVTNNVQLRQVFLMLGRGKQHGWWVRLVEEWLREERFQSFSQCQITVENLCSVKFQNWMISVVIFLSVVILNSNYAQRWIIVCVMICFLSVGSLFSAFPIWICDDNQRIIYAIKSGQKKFSTTF